MTMTYTPPAGDSPSERTPATAPDPARNGAPDTAPHDARDTAPDPPPTSGYAFLLLPSHNRVYAATAPRLARAELLATSEAVLGGRIRAVAETRLGGVPYLTFQAPGLTDEDLRYLGNLSSLYALFQVGADGRLAPVTAPGIDRFGSELITIQKYPGKTNEEFTKLLLNLTALACAEPHRLLAGELRVFDPLCGRGTTLNQAVMYGLDAAGVEWDTRSFEAYENFLRHWLKSSRLKHRAETTTVRRNRRALGRRLDVTLGATREEYKRGERIEVSMVNADTTASGDFFRPGSFDLIVTDAPYGVQHGSTAHGPAGAGRTRSPMPLLEAALPVWTRLLRPGGAIGISWNTHVASRDELTGLLTRAGFAVRDSEPYLDLAHRVDQAIVRDLVVASAPGPAGAPAAS
ncbi:SAM-dependent methyltransferase [Streptomyces sp. B6B3]|uniref:TRM11 family SAM-dependent methyltransferase n=1 Tax=Streptomyces sp. B6B3 TaxID=3153570 RepID=UPI00325F2A94